MRQPDQRVTENVYKIKCVATSVTGIYSSFKLMKAFYFL